MEKQKKFAFVVHLRSSYRKDLAYMAKPLGLIPDAVYRFLLRGRPLNPFIWSEVTLSPGATEPEGYIIMLPYSGRQLLEQQKQMLPLLQKAAKLAHSKGADLLGLGALTSPITLGGKLLADNPYTAVTNGNAFTSVITFQKLARLIQQHPAEKPTVALVGATGSVGSLVCKLLAQEACPANFHLVARNRRRLTNLAVEMQEINEHIKVSIGENMDEVKHADMVVLLTSASENLLMSENLKQNAIVLDDTQPRNTSPALVQQRPDVKVIDGGLVSMPYLRFLQNSISLPKGISFACLAETMLLAKAGHNGNFSLGNPTLEQANYITQLAAKFSHLGFGIAPDHSFGKPICPTLKPLHAAVDVGSALQVA